MRKSGCRAFGFLPFCGKPAAATQLCAQGQHQIEDDADAREVLAGEAAAGLVGVDYAQRVGQGRPGQMVVGDQHAQSEAVGGGNALDARDAVIDRDQDVGLLELAGELHYLGREAIAVLEAVRHQIIHHCAEFAQRTQAHCAGSRAVGVVIGDDQQPLPGRDRIGQDGGHARDVMHAIEWRESAQCGCELLRRADSARGINARKQRVQAGSRQRCGLRSRHDAGGDDARFRHVEPTAVRGARISTSRRQRSRSACTGPRRAQRAPD